MSKKFRDTVPYPGDLDNVLLGKILQRLNGIASPGDTDAVLLGKILTQLNSVSGSAQPLDGTLTALAAFNTNGLLAQTASDVFAGRTLTAGSSKITITNGDGVAGNPTIDADLSAQVLKAGDTMTGTLAFATAKMISIASGTNQRAGNTTLVGGTKTVANTTVTANTIVLLTRKTSGGTPGTGITYTLSAGVSFTINSDNVLDTSTFSYFLIEVP